MPLLAAASSQEAAAQGLGTDYDVIVLGAGVAGLAAAERLVSLDDEIKVLVLEARDRIGGRVHSVGSASSSRDADLGALSLKQSLGADWPVAERLGLHVDEFSDGSLGLYPGMSALVRALAESSTGRVQLDSAVREVFWREGLVGVNYMNRGLSSAVTARRLVISLPAGVLRSGALAISPALPVSKLEALNALNLEPALSFAFLFPPGSARLRDPSQPWLFEDATTRLRAFPGGAENDLLLEAQFRGARADALAGQPESLQLALALRAFEPAFEALPSLDAARWSGATNWLSEQFSRGAATQAATTLTHLELARSLGGTVFFAGEATADPADVGTVHGAYDSGERAAREVALSLNLELELADPNEPILELL
ncbi:putative NAD/FAD-dependent oxidoreductase [Congregibacter litoralis KT71]|uniref:Tryptophan 2-monooxygenase n=1 Tax=Congregibacter litoralis KT71 TaxID=314285 RepID=A4A3E4_9GAMM|nr:putative NAD/FAD-dependent oxidoreductase [Congregibacter litoralis KT71]